jgi:hypothetical protein
MPVDLRVIQPPQLARAYGIPHVVDYGNKRPGRGLLVTTGAGMLMSDMDVLPYCRWAVDLGAGRNNPRAGDFIEACSHLCTHLVAHVWMSLTDPRWMADVVARFPKDRVVVWASPPLPYPVGDVAENIGELIAWTPLR